MFKRILLPTDGSDLSLKAVRLGVELAKCCGANVVAMHVVPPVQALPYIGEIIVAMEFDYAKEAARYAERYLDAAQAIAEKAGVAFDRQVMVGMQPYEAILRTAAEQTCDLIVMATHSWSGLTRILLGNEAHKVILKSDIPVLVCH